MKKIYLKAINNYFKYTDKLGVEEDKNIFECYNDFSKDFLNSITFNKQEIHETLFKCYDILSNNRKKLTNLNYESNKQEMISLIYNGFTIIESMMYDLINITKENQDYEIFRDKFKTHFLKNKLWRSVKSELDEADNLDSDSENSDLDSNSDEENDSTNSTGSFRSEEDNSDSENENYSNSKNGTAAKIIDAIWNDGSNSEETGKESSSSSDSEETGQEISGSFDSEEETGQRSPGFFNNKGNSNSENIYSNPKKNRDFSSNAWFCEIDDVTSSGQGSSNEYETGYN